MMRNSVLKSRTPLIASCNSLIVLLRSKGCKYERHSGKLAPTFWRGSGTVSVAASSHNSYTPKSLASCKPYKRYIQPSQFTVPLSKSKSNTPMPPLLVAKNIRSALVWLSTFCLMRSVISILKKMYRSSSLRSSNKGDTKQSIQNNSPILLR